MKIFLATTSVSSSVCGGLGISAGTLAFSTGITHYVGVDGCRTIKATADRFFRSTRSCSLLRCHGQRKSYHYDQHSTATTVFGRLASRSTPMKNIKFGHRPNPFNLLQQLRLYRGGEGGGGGSSDNEDSDNIEIDEETATTAIDADDNNDNKNDDDDIPYREHGYRSKPFSWDELVRIVNGDERTGLQPNLAIFSRSIEVERSYSKAKKEIFQTYETIADHILHSKFGLARHFNATSQRYYVSLPPPPPSSESEASESGSTQGTNTDSISINNVWEVNDNPRNGKSIVLAPNEFPYYVQDGIEHWVLWKLYDAITEDDVNYALRRLAIVAGKTRSVADSTDYDGDDFSTFDSLWWENPPHLKSLPQINHVHFLIRQRRRS